MTSLIQNQFSTGDFIANFKNGPIVRFNSQMINREKKTIFTTHFSFNKKHFASALCPTLC